MKTILVPVDFSDVTEAVVRAAQDTATAFESQVVLLHVAPPDPDFVGYDPGPPSVREHVAQQLHEEHEQLHALKSTLQLDPKRITALVIQGPVVEKVLQEAERLSADLIVVGSHGHGALHDLLVGSVTEGVLRGATCPVLVLPAAKR